MEVNFKTAVATLTLIPVVLLSLSCSGPKASSAATVAPPSPTPAAQTQAQPAVKTPAAPKEVLVAGNPGSILANTEPDKAVNIEFILDASGSMLEKIGGSGSSKIDMAKEVLGKLVQDLPPSLKLGLRVYGNRYPESDKANSCQDIQLLVPLGQGNASSITAQIQSVQPKGWTPIAAALQQAAQDMSGSTQNINNVVLLSDGDEECGGQPADVARQVKDGPAGLTVHTIGFGVDENGSKQLQEIADASGGSYNEANDAQGLMDAVSKALLAARSGTFLRAEVAGEGERQVSVSVWLTEPGSGKKLHEMRSWVDSPIAPGVYDLLVGTAPRVVYRGVEIKAHTRTTIRLGVGGIRVELADAQGQPIKAMAHLIDRDSGTTLRDFATWYNQPALAGSYDIRIDSNPPVSRKNIQVSEKGLAIVDLRNGSLRVDAMGLGGERPNWEIELRDGDSGEAIYKSMVGREQAVMSGDYRLVVLAHPQISMPVKIGAGEVKTVRLDTGLLRVELLDNRGQRVNLSVALQDSQGKEAGSFSTWEDATPLPGTYQMVIPTQPEIRQAVQVSPTQPTIIRLRTP